MYPSYPNDSHAQSLDIAARAVEGPNYHTRLLSGTISVSCTANTLSSASTTFSRPFTTTPNIVYSLKTVGDPASTIKFADLSAEDGNGFTLRIMTDTAQTLIYTWYAIGDAS